MEMMFESMSELFETEYDVEIVEAQINAWSENNEEQGDACPGCAKCDMRYLFT